MFIVGNFLIAVAKILSLALNAFLWIVIARAVLSWVNRSIQPHRPVHSQHDGAGALPDPPAAAVVFGGSTWRRSFVNHAVHVSGAFCRGEPL